MRICAMLAITVVAMPVIAFAQAQDGHHPVEIPSSAQALPGDYFDLSQSDQLRVPLGPPAGRNPHPATGQAIRSSGPGADLAAQAAEAAVKSCAADGYTVAVAITDGAGNLRAALAPPGARPNGVFMAMHKAVAVVGLGMSTLEFRQKLETQPSLMSRVKPNMALLPGGVPIMRDGTIIGAIATSGASAHVEEKCARDGIARIQAHLGDF